MNKKNLLIFLLILGTGFWGISFPITKSGVGTSLPFVFLSYRFLIAALAMLLIFPSSLRKFDRKVMKVSFLLAVPLFAGILLQTYGLKYSPAGQCAFIAGLGVVVLPFINFIFFKKRVQNNILLAAVIAVTGLYVISVKDGFQIGIGDVYTLLGTIGFSVYLINVSRYSTPELLLPSVTLMFLICSVFSVAMAVTSGDAQWVTSDQDFWVGVLFSSLLSTAFMYSVSNKAQQYISPEKVSIIFLFEPIFASIAAFLLLNEPFTWKLLIGGFLIISAMLVAEFGGKRILFRS